MFLVSVCFVSFWYQDHLYSVYAGLVGLRYPNPHKHSKRNHLFWYQGCTTCLYSWKSQWFWCQKSTAHAYTQNVKKNNLIYKSVPPISYRFQNHCFICSVLFEYMYMHVLCTFGIKIIDFRVYATWSTCIHTLKKHICNPKCGIFNWRIN